MIQIWEMQTKRIKVRKYLQRIQNKQSIQARNIEATFNHKDYKEIERLHYRCNSINKLFPTE